jgi:ribosomal protein S18 acetylase RimI-like enzyme
VKLTIVPLQKSHDRSTFDCGVEALNTYLQQRAGQDMRNHYASVFVSLEDETERINGFYTLSNTRIRLDTLEYSVAKKLPRYPDVPAIRLGRLAVDDSKQGQGFGTALLADAVIRCVSNVSAWATLVVDAKDESAAAFYRGFGFTSLLDDDSHLFITRKPLVDFIASIAEEGQS